MNKTHRFQLSRFQVSSIWKKTAVHVDKQRPRNTYLRTTYVVSTTFPVNVVKTAREEKPAKAPRTPTGKRAISRRSVLKGHARTCTRAPLSFAYTQRVVSVTFRRNFWFYTVFNVAHSLQAVRRRRMRARTYMLCVRKRE